MTAHHRPAHRRKHRLTRFADRLGLALLFIHATSIVASCIALWLGLLQVAWPFLGAGICAGVTLILITLFERRLNG